LRVLKRDHRERSSHQIQIRATLSITSRIGGVAQRGEG
jgi:hypothetical protein